MYQTAALFCTAAPGAARSFACCSGVTCVVVEL
jgi:hypothetical protein